MLLLASRAIPAMIHVQDRRDRQRIGHSTQSGRAGQLWFGRADARHDASLSFIFILDEDWFVGSVAFGRRQERVDRRLEWSVPGTECVVVLPSDSRDAAGVQGQMLAEYVSQQNAGGIAERGIEAAGQC